MDWLNDETHRAYVYRIALAALAILVAYDVINGTQQAVWATALEAILAIGSAGLATKNTSRKKIDTDH